MEFANEYKRIRRFDPDNPDSKAAGAAATDQSVAAITDALHSARVIWVSWVDPDEPDAINSRMITPNGASYEEVLVLVAGAIEALTGLYSDLIRSGG